MNFKQINMYNTNIKWKAKREQGENMGYSHEIQPFIQQVF